MTPVGSFNKANVPVVDGEPAMRLSPVVPAHRPPKAAMLVAQSIIRDVIGDGLKPGSLLPSERAMLEKYQTGRGTLREALRLLEFQGVISLKPGSHGGPVLQDPSASHLASTFVLLMQLKEVPFRNIVEVRSALEPVISRLAAQHIDESALAALGETIEQMQSLDKHSFFEANKRFHAIIAWSSGNALFGYIVDSVLGILEGTTIGIDFPAHRRLAILNAHVAIFEALKEGDAEASETHMRDHIVDDVRYAERKFPQIMDHIIRWDRMG